MFILSPATCKVICGLCDTHMHARTLSDEALGVLIGLCIGEKTFLSIVYTSVRGHKSPIQVAFRMLMPRLVLFSGEHDVRPGRERHARREGGQAGVHWLVNQDANHWRRQADHPHRNSQPPLCYHVAPPRLPSQRTVGPFSYVCLAESVRWYRLMLNPRPSLSACTASSRASKTWRSASVASTCTTRSTRARRPLSPTWPPAPPPTSPWPSTTSWTLCTVR